MSQTQIKAHVFSQEINPFHLHTHLFPHHLNNDSFSWPGLLRLSMLAGGQLAARPQPHRVQDQPKRDVLLLVLAHANPEVQQTEAFPELSKL